MTFWILWLIIAPIIWIIMPTRMIGKKYLKSIKKQSAIYSCNHQTLNDPIIIKSRCPKTKCMAKSELFKNKFTNWLFRNLGAFPVDRGGNDIAAVKTTLKYLKENKKVLIFPEGTRVKEGESSEYKNGLVMFALKTDSYVVPMIFKKRTKVFVFNTLIIGKPFKFSEMEEFRDVKINKDILQNASDILANKMQKLKEINVKEYKKQLKLDYKANKNAIN